MEQITIERIPPASKFKAAKVKKLKKKKRKVKVKKAKRAKLKRKKVKTKVPDKSKAELKKTARDLAIKVKATETRGIVNTMLKLFARKSGSGKTSEFEMSFLKSVASAEDTFKFFTNEYKKAKKEIEKITNM